MKRREKLPTKILFAIFVSVKKPQTSIRKAPSVLTGLLINKNKHE
jgi:hypothetical protein